MTDYSNILKEISEGIKNKDFAVFCGAGISFNSGLPTVPLLAESILKKLDVKEEYIKEIMPNLKLKLPFEAFMETLAENSNISKILNLFKEGESNANQILIAKLAKVRLIKIIVTTNFDMLIEKALEKEGLVRNKDFKVYYTENQFSEIDFNALNNSNKISVFKVHGSIEDMESIRTTMKAVASEILSEKRQNVLKYIFSDESHKNVLVLGYSCSDFFDINPQIQRIENSENKIFFVDYDETTTYIKDIKDKNLKNGNKNPFNKFNGYIVECNTDNLVKDIWNCMNGIIEKEYELKKYKIEWQIFVNGWGDNLKRDIKHFICGQIFYKLSDFKKAIEFHENSLKIAKEIGDKAGESTCYKNLCNAYQSLGDFRKAIEFHENSLKIFKEIGDKAGESKCYGNLGNAYQSLGDFKKAIEFHENYLKITKEIGDKAGESKCYGNLGIAYSSLGDFRKAIVFYENSLKIFKEIGDKAGESACYTNLGDDYQSLCDFRKAIEFYLKAEEIFEEIGQKHYLKIVYKNIVDVYEKMNNPEKAEEYKRKAEEI